MQSTSTSTDDKIVHLLFFEEGQKKAEAVHVLIFISGDIEGRKAATDGESFAM